MYEEFNPGDRVLVSYFDRCTEGIVIKMLPNRWVLVAQPYADTVLAVECAAEYVELTESAKDRWL